MITEACWHIRETTTFRIVRNEIENEKSYYYYYYYYYTYLTIHEWMGSCCCFTTTWMLNCHSNKVPTNWDGSASRICTKSSTYGKKAYYKVHPPPKGGWWGGLGQWEQWSNVQIEECNPLSLLYIYASWAHVPVRHTPNALLALLNGQVQLCHDIWNYKLLKPQLAFCIESLWLGTWP